MVFFCLPSNRERCDGHGDRYANALTDSMSPPSVAKATCSDYAKQVVVIHIKTRQWQIWPVFLFIGCGSKSILFALR